MFAHGISVCVLLLAAQFAILECVLFCVHEKFMGGQKKTLSWKVCITSRVIHRRWGHKWLAMFQIKIAERSSIKRFENHLGDLTEFLVKFIWRHFRWWGDAIEINLGASIMNGCNPWLAPLQQILQQNMPEELSQSPQKASTKPPKTTGH